MVEEVETQAWASPCCKHLGAQWNSQPYIRREKNIYDNHLLVFVISAYIEPLKRVLDNYSWLWEWRWALYRVREEIPKGRKKKETKEKVEIKGGWKRSLKMVGGRGSSFH